MGKLKTVRHSIYGQRDLSLQKTFCALPCASGRYLRSLSGSLARNKKLARSPSFMLTPICPWDLGKTNRKHCLSPCGRGSGGKRLCRVNRKSAAVRKSTFFLKRTNEIAYLDPPGPVASLAMAGARRPLPFFHRRPDHVPAVLLCLVKSLVSRFEQGLAVSGVPGV